MHRILVSLIVIFGSVSLYLCIRFLKQHKIGTETLNAIMFIPVAITFLVRSLISGENLRIGWKMLVTILPVGFFFGRLSNVMSLKSIQSAPNIGYSLMIAKSYVVLSSVLAVPLMGSILNSIDLIAILLVVGSMFLVLVEPGSVRESKESIWVRQAAYAHIGRAGLALSSAWFIKQGLSPLVVNTWLFSIVSIIILIEAWIKDYKLIPSSKSVFPALGVVLSMIVFNRALQEGYAVAPNPGYINAANASSIAVLTLLSARIFGDALSQRKLI